MRILGVSAFYHDSAAALIEDGAIIAAAQEERFTRIRHDRDYPRFAIEACLKQAGITLKDIDCVAFYDKPFVTFERLLETYLAFAPRGFRSFSKAIPVWLREKLFQRQLLSRELTRVEPGIDWASKLLFAEHHQSHAASAFFPSPFEEAVVLTLDGVGEWATASVAIGKGPTLSVKREIHFPHSLGLLYSAFTYYCGFRVNSAEYKLMGLAPYGTPRYRQLILDTLIDVKEDGSFRLAMRYFNYCTGLTMTSRHFHALFRADPRRPEEPIGQLHCDLAASVQSVLEEVVLRMTRSLARETGLRNLCLAGGVALNCVANGKILRDGAFEHVWVQPAAGDAGGALGAALAAYHIHHGRPRQLATPDLMQGSCLGPSFTQPEIEECLVKAGAVFDVLENDAVLTARTADALAAGNVAGWVQDRMEFGPRALGNRSILADPRNPDMQKLLNLKVKFRESFRPFAPSVLEEDASEWFAMDGLSPYMMFTAPVQERHRLPVPTGEAALSVKERLARPRSSVPAVTHVDFSSRLQTVHKHTHPLYHALLSAFKARTGCPILINTSFNIRGEPIVCTPEDAFRCFMGCDIDLLIIGRCWLTKERQDPALMRSYKDNLPPD